MKRICRLALVVTGTLLVGNSVWAQEEAAKAPDLWSLSATLGSQFTDNRDGVKTNKTSNLDVFFSPRADLRWRDGERSYLDLFVIPSLKWHSDPRPKSGADGQHSTELFAAGGVDAMHMISPRVMVGGGDTIAYTDDPDITEGGTSVRRSSSYLLNSANARVNGAITETVGASLLGGAVTKRYSDSVVAKDQDEDNYNIEANLKYLMGAGYNVFGTVGWMDLNTQSSGAGARDRGAEVMSYGVGVEKIFSPDFVGKVVGGYQQAEFDDGTLDSTDTANGHGELTFRAASPTRFRVGATYGFFAPYVRPYSLQTLTAVNGAIDHDLLQNRLTLTLLGQYSQGDYDEEGPGLPGGKDNLGTVGVKGSYRLNRNWSVSAGYTYENWDSDVRESFDRNLVDVGVTAQL